MSSELLEDCIHGLPPRSCGFCTKPSGPQPRRRSSSRSTPDVLDSPEAIDRNYRHRYPPDREATFDAYLDVFFRLPEARRFPGGWTSFSRCANAEPALVRGKPELVRRAEELMRVGGYELDDSGRARGRGRKWFRAGS